MTSWLVRSSPNRAVRVRTLAGDMVLCSWARQFILTVPLSIQVYKWVPVNLILEVTLQWTSIPPRRGGSRDKLRPDEPLGSYADFNLKSIKRSYKKVFICQVLFCQIIVFYAIILESL